MLACFATPVSAGLFHIVPLHTAPVVDQAVYQSLSVFVWQIHHKYSSDLQFAAYSNASSLPVVSIVFILSLNSSFIDLYELFLLLFKILYIFPFLFTIFFFRSLFEFVDRLVVFSTS